MHVDFERYSDLRLWFPCGPRRELPVAHFHPRVHSDPFSRTLSGRGDLIWKRWDPELQFMNL